MVNNEKKSLPLVSIIIDNYNYGRFIQDAIESALNQTYPNVEVIVVDDGSTDNSREIISRYASAGLVKAVLKENGGQASAMNAGFEVSSGDLVVFLDSDDVLKPEAIEVAVRAWYPGVSKVQWRLERVNSNLDLLNIFDPPLGAKLVSADIKRIMYRWFSYPTSPQSGNMYYRGFLNRAMPLPENEWKICADFPLFTAAAFYGDIVSLPDVLGYYRRHGENSLGLTVEPYSITLRRMHSVRKYLTEKFPECTADLNPENLDEKKARLISQLVEGELPSGYFERARRGLSGFLDSLSYPFFSSKMKRMEAALWFLATGLLPTPLARIAALKAVKEKNQL